MSNADSFLSHFNDIEHWMRQKLELYDNLSFVEMIRELKPKNPIIRRFSDDLYQYASLRNAIVHTRKGNVTIAEPYLETVVAIEQIKNELLNPKRVGIQPNIFTVREITSLELFLNELTKLNYSQAPVVDEEFSIIEIINTNTVARWLAANISNDLVSIKETTIADILPHAEYKSNYIIIPKGQTYYAAAESFQAHALRFGHNPDAILVTEHGKNTERLIGILCLEDLAPFFIKQ